MNEESYMIISVDKWQASVYLCVIIRLFFRLDTCFNEFYIPEIKKKLTTDKIYIYTKELISPF